MLCLLTELFIYKTGYRLMDCDILLRKIVIILVIRIEIFHFLFVNRYTQLAFVIRTNEVAAVGTTCNICRQWNRKFQIHDNLRTTLLMDIIVVVCLYLRDFYRIMD